MMRSDILVLGLGLVGCGPTADAFAAEYPDALCTWVEECAWSPEHADTNLPDPLDDTLDEVCREQVTETLADAEADSACTYSEKQARQCLAALAASCDERTAIYYECKRVYSGDDCEVELASGL